MQRLWYKTKGCIPVENSGVVNNEPKLRWPELTGLTDSVSSYRGALRVEGSPVNISWKLAAKAAMASVVFAGVASYAPAANAVSYSTSGFSLSGLGDTIGSSYDQLTGTSISGNFADGDTIQLNKLSFTAGINATVPYDYTNGYFSISETMTIGGGAQTPISVPFNLNISYSDTLTIVNGTSFSLTDAGGALWQVVVNGLTIGPNSGGSMGGWLTATVTDPPLSQAPLPAALPLFASGLGGMGLVALWRKRKAKAAA